MSEGMEKNTPANMEEPEIFGQSKSREEIKAEERAAKAAQRAVAKAAAAQRRANRQPIPKEKRTDLIVISCILGAMVLLIPLLLFINHLSEAKQARFERDEAFTTYFLDSNAADDLELADDGITAAVYQAYYTKGGYLAVEMILGNGTATEQHLDAIAVELRNGDTEAVIASGKTSSVSENYTIPAGETKEYTLYISPEHITVRDDPLTTISYTITADGIAIGGESSEQGETSGTETSGTETTGTESSAEE